MLLLQVVLEEQGAQPLPLTSLHSIAAEAQRQLDDIDHSQLTSDAMWIELRASMLPTILQAGKQLEYLTGGHVRAGMHEVRTFNACPAEHSEIQTILNSSVRQHILTPDSAIVNLVPQKSHASQVESAAVAISGMLCIYHNANHFC